MDCYETQFLFHLRSICRCTMQFQQCRKQEMTSSIVLQHYDLTSYKQRLLIVKHHWWKVVWICYNHRKFGKVSSNDKGVIAFSKKVHVFFFCFFFLRHPVLVLRQKLRVSPNYSEPKFKIDPIKMSKSLHFWVTGSSTFRKIVKRLYNANEACWAIHFWLRYQFPFLKRVIPKYLKESTRPHMFLLMKRSYESVFPFQRS